MKTFRPLPGKFGFYWPSKSFAGPNYFNIGFFIEGFLQAFNNHWFILPYNRAATIRVFISPPLFSLAEVQARVGVKYFSKYLSQVQVLFHICKYKYKFKYSEYLEDIKYIKYFFNQVRVKYKYFGNKQ